MEIIQNIVLDLANHSMFELVAAKQGDSASRFVCAALTRNGAAYTPPEGVSARFRCLKPDGYSCDYPAVVNENGTVTVELTEQALAAPGTVHADIVLTGSGGEVLSTATFIIQVNAAPVGENAASSDEFLSFAGIIEKSNQLLGEYETALDQLEGIRDEVKKYAEQAGQGGSGGVFTAAGEDDALVITTSMTVSADGDAILIGGD